MDVWHLLLYSFASLLALRSLLLLMANHKRQHKEQLVAEHRKQQREAQIQKQAQQAEAEQQAKKLQTEDAAA